MLIKTQEQRQLHRINQLYQASLMANLMLKIMSKDNQLTE
jgi:hypothetical protein